MAEIESGGTNHGPGRVRIAIWMGVCALLLAPLVAMQFTSEVVWTASDFLVFGLMLLAALGSYELAVRKTGSSTYRWAAGIAAAAGFFLVWINLAVGVIGSEDNPANLMFAGVLAVALLGALGARRRPGRMAYALFATAFAQLAVGVVALTGDLGADGNGWPRDVIGSTAIFTMLWLVSAALFRRAARDAMAA